MIFKSCLIFVSQDYRADSVITNRLTVEEEDIHCGVDYSQYSVQCVVRSDSLRVRQSVLPLPPPAQT